MITANEIRQKYLDFFVARGHKIIPPAPLVLENDPTTLFTSSGMQPLVPYLLGQPHPSGKGLVNSQPSFRAQDIEEVGDNRHTTFFEMLGNWSLGDYFKEDQLSWFYEFLTRELKLPAEKLYVSVFEGYESVPKDVETAQIWKKLGIPENRIFYYGVDKNWWSRSGTPDQMPAGEPGGPDSEVFYDFGTKHNPKYGKECHPNCECGRFLEIGNSVFMQYKKEADGSLSELPKKNVDFGGGLERLTAAVNNDPDVFNIDVFMEAKKILVDAQTGGEIKNIRVILDHIRAAVFLIDAGVIPSNKMQGYVLRRLIRRSAVHARLAGIRLANLLPNLVKGFRDSQNSSEIILAELSKFEETLEKGMKLIGKVSSFDLYQTYGFPPEITDELLEQKGEKLDWAEFEKQKQAHQDLSRISSKGMFKGGLQDQSEKTTKYHTATHLLHAALRQVLGNHVQQKGSNITAERLRFDFSHPKKLSAEEINTIEKLVNQKVEEDLKVEKLEMDKDKALTMGALAFFPEKYPAKTSVYKIGEISLELCGGPHVQSTGEIGRIKLTRQEQIGAGIQRVYAQLE